jgi:uncharacterized membrane protein YphA (DoxX/SURF4 family)
VGVDRLARLAVGLVLLAAGALKGGSRTWVQEAGALGAPRPVALALPWVEVALGALLVADVGGRTTSLAALVLLVGFTVLVAGQVLRGRRVPCACFGQFSRKPMGPGAVVRNVVLVALAAVGAAA